MKDEQDIKTKNVFNNSREAGKIKVGVSETKYVKTYVLI